MPKIKIFPSVLAADMGHLEDECRRAEAAGADGLHLDIMDGHFVNNISFGFEIVRYVREWVNIPLSVHLMISRPDQYWKRCVEWGADTLLIHQEVSCDVPEILQGIRAAGVRPGITLNPDTPADAVSNMLGEVDEVLCMSVYPGYGGQLFIAEVLPKVKELRARNPKLDISIDGGITRETANQAAAQGANIFQVGTTVFRATDIVEEIREMRAGATEAFGA